MSQDISRYIVEGQVPLPQSIVRLEVFRSGRYDLELPNIKELKQLFIHEAFPTNITEQNFPSLKFIQLIRPAPTLFPSSLSPTKFMNEGLIKSVQLIKKEYLVELSCFPWCIQYPCDQFIFIATENSKQLLEGRIPLHQSVVRLDIWLEEPVNIEIQLPNIKELIFHEAIPTNITEQNFPSLKFIQLIRPAHTLFPSSLSPTKFMNEGLIQSAKLIKNECLVELSCFPWCIQYPYDQFNDVYPRYCAIEESKSVLKGQLALPQSQVRLEVLLNRK
ncbi:hypothetical protein P9112_006400 [Eukaryota sp. TZLM1-RC]